MARWLQLSGLHLPGLVADRPGPVDVCSVWPEDLRHGRHHLPPLAHPVVDVVRGDLVRDVAEERRLGIGLQDALGFGSYETPGPGCRSCGALWSALTESFCLVVELDETFVGGRSHGKPGGSSDKVPVMVAVERLGPHQLGHVRFGVGDAPGTLQLLQFATDTIEPGSLIHTDGARILRRLVPQRLPVPGPHRRTPPRAPGRVAAQALDRRHPAPFRQRQAPALLPRRVQLPLQPKKLQRPRDALLPAPAASRRHRPTAAHRAHQSRRSLTAHKQIGRTCVCPTEPRSKPSDRDALSSRMPGTTRTPEQLGPSGSAPPEVGRGGRHGNQAAALEDRAGELGRVAVDQRRAHPQC